MSSILTFKHCYDTDVSSELKKCFEHTGIPLIFVLVFVSIKVLCLKQQRIFLWSGFTVCLIAQLIVFKAANVQLLVDIASQQQEDQDKIAQVMMFFPCVAFSLAADVQIIVSTLQYKPIAFAKMPFGWIRPVMLFLGALSLALTVVTFIVCIVVFGEQP